MVASKKTETRGLKGKRTAGEKNAEKKTARPRAAGSIDPIITIDRRQNRDRRTPAEPPAPPAPVAMERRAKVNRRRQIDPTTCERDYTPDEIEFMGAMDQYKRRSGRMFPTCSEVLEVLKSLGYSKALAMPVLPVADLAAAVSTVPTVVA